MTLPICKDTDEAEQMNRAGLEGQMRVLGVDHPETLHGMYNLARALCDLQRYDEAEKMDRAALEGSNANSWCRSSRDA